ncbi:MAG: phytanoyl-CoA dioxygenase family protein [Alphaproteobacteria bacterium]|nr:phytanoyl-CoA dioxygenase family protein [Alphaproteobacteria bacterium]
MLGQDQIDSFHRDGFLVAPDAVTPAQLAALNRTLTGWVDESRAHTQPFGPPCIDGRARFDMGAEHTAARPALRRVNCPSDISPEYEAVMRDSAMVDMVAALIGENLKFLHCKINLKLPCSNTEVGYHQDFAYVPHTNSDVVTALLMLDDVTEDNGALTVVPGSHKGPVHTLYHGGHFTGSVSDELTADAKRRAVPAIGKAGSVCLMHARLLHGSAVNRSPRSRNLYICIYTAADAAPLCRNSLPNTHEGQIVRGRASRIVRCDVDRVELPIITSAASFFATQGQRSAG